MSFGPWERMASSLRLPSPVEPLYDDRLRHNGVHVFLKRDDLIHPEVSGNKWRKLKYNLIEADRQNYKTLLTFGGAYSNHIRATAAAGSYCGFSTIGIIRGEEHLPLNPSLAYAASQGMRLSYMDRPTYRRKSESDVITSLQERFGSFYLLPEGGSNELAVRGCSEIPAEIETDFDVICCPMRHRRDISRNLSRPQPRAARHRIFRPEGRVFSGKRGSRAATAYLRLLLRKLGHRVRISFRRLRQKDSRPRHIHH